MIEILSPSTRQVDLHLEQRRYVERAHAVGTDEIEVSLPYRLTINPRDLLA